MIDLEQRIAQRLHERVADVRVDDGLAAVMRSAEQRPTADVRSRRVVLAAAASLVMLVAGGLFVIARDGEHPTPRANSLPGSDDLIYPIVENDDLPDGISPSFTRSEFHNDDMGWNGVVGVLGAVGAPPTDLVSITVFPTGFDPAFTDAQPGRRAGVQESDNVDSTTLIWELGSHVLTMVGDDRSTMYEILDVVELSSEGGYRLNAPLPDGFTVLAAPTRSQADMYPALYSDPSFLLNVQVGFEPPLVSFAAAGEAPTRVVSGRFDGYGADLGNGTMVAVTISPTRSMVVESNVLGLDELIDVVDHIELVDLETWRQTYQMPITNETLVPVTTVG